MPIIASAKKYMRVSARKRAQNNRWRFRIEHLQRKLKKAVVAHNAADAQSLFRTLQKTLDAAAQRRVIHKNAAARTKSRLAHALQRLSGQ